tara:strand:- start:257 stop:379 length:123 start_codon:yes stop_codon:yes gene_type:complete
MQATVKRMLALRDWCEFFELVGADAPSMPRSIAFSSTRFP